MSHNLLKEIALEYGGAAVANANNTDSNSTRFDMQGYEGLLVFTTVTDCVSGGVATLNVESNTIDSDTGMAAISGATAAATSANNDDLNGLTLCVNVYRPVKRYVQAVRTSATQNIAFGEVYVIRYNGRQDPVTLATNAASASVVGS